MNNKRLYERLAKIEKKENNYIKSVNKGGLYYKNKVIYNNIQRKIKEDKITAENDRLVLRMGKL